MNKSENINELAKALSLFQGELRDLYKDKAAYGYKYSDLSQCLELVRPLLFKYGLSMVQIPGSASDKVSLETVLMHESGQWLSGTLEMPVTVGKGISQAQAVGSVISYARRYSLTSWLGIAQSDNDASIVSVEESKPAMMITSQVIQQIYDLVGEDSERIKKICSFHSVANLNDLELGQGFSVINQLKRLPHASKSDQMVSKLEHQMQKAG